MKTYVITIQGEVVCVCQMDAATKAKVQEQIDSEPFIQGRITEAGDIITSPFAIETTVESVIDMWRL